MCGRFTLTQSGEAIARQFQLSEMPSVEPRYNIAPTQPAPVIRLDEAGSERRFDYLYWGLIPSWAKDPKMGARMINARSETIAEKPAFRAALKRRRCLIVADGFYEWQRSGNIKQPYYFYLKNLESTQTDETHRKLFAFAGLWEHWQDADGNSIESCTILTTIANATLATMHERMPVILQPHDYELWLDPAVQSVEPLRSLFAPYAATAMGSYPVSTQVNAARLDAPDCIQPIALDS